MNHIERCKAEWGHGIATFEFWYLPAERRSLKVVKKDVDERIMALQLWCAVHGLVSLANTQRLLIVDGNCSQGKDCEVDR